jgi:nucleotide sugar dehydrogenase
MKVAVIGMGKIGLPLAVQYARKNHNVTGVDINPTTVNLINSGREPFPEEKNLNEFLLDVVKQGKLKATQNYEEAIESANVIVVVVPLFVDSLSQPDFTAMDLAAEGIGKSIKKGALVCFETTLPVGITRKRLIPLIEKNSGFTAGKDFFVVFSPERVFTSRVFEDLKKYPKIVGGLTETCTKKATEFYESVIDFDIRDDLNLPNGVWQMNSIEEAEFVKLAETTYRDVNIALANQFSVFAEKSGLNIYKVIQAANSQPFSQIHKPGVSVGGHCIPIYPQFYLLGDKDASIVREARHVNSKMPDHIGQLLLNKKGSLKNLKVLVLGISYRANVKESAFSGVFPLCKFLSEKGAEVEVVDPFFSEKEILELNLTPFNGNSKLIDTIIVHTDHLDFTNLIKKEFQNVKLVVDGRNLIRQNMLGKNTELLTIGIGRDIDGA